MFGGGLFTEYFLNEGVRTTEAWRGLSAEEASRLASEIAEKIRAFDAFSKPSEAETDKELVEPILALLGWHTLPQQEAGKGRKDIPDALLFVGEDAKNRAKRHRQQADRYRHGAVVAEYEARETPLDRASGTKETPSSQIIRYLGRASDISGGIVRWGLLSNGRLWRIYWAGARSRVEGYLEIDLPAAVAAAISGDTSTGGDAFHVFRLFLLFFSRTAFEPTGPTGAIFLDEALAEGRHYEERVTAALSEAVFDRVFPVLVSSLSDHDPKTSLRDASWRAEAKEAALILLYRFLFILSAEDRDLLPIRHPGYVPYSLRALRDEAARLIDAKTPISEKAQTWWPKILALFEAIANGDTSMGLPPYNGRLFEDSRAPLLARISLPDGVLATLIDQLSREGPEGNRRYINYRDLSVQHLGAIYERLLEHEVVEDEGALGIRLNAFARKNTGSYYTHDDLVRLVLRRAVKPLLVERLDAYRAKAAALSKERRPKAARIDELGEADPATAYLKLRICDPAMGSGHFLVSLVDYLADETLSAMAEVVAVTRESFGAESYRSPLARQVETIRDHIRAQADSHDWLVTDDQLDDKHIVRRIILKRVIYGVDLNPMAVELAKLSLWLHSFTVGAPLSFLDHHLRCGDSLFGEFVRPVEDIAAEQAAMFLAPIVTQAHNAAKGMAMVEQLTDADIAEVRTSASTFEGVEEAIAPLAHFMDFIHAARWLGRMSKEEEQVKIALLSGTLGDPIAILSGKQEPRGKEAVVIAAKAVLDRTAGLIGERRFLHWEVAFPGVWTDWDSAEPSGGFDAVIGNPPWDRMKLEEVEWFEARVPEIAKAARASDRKKLVDALRKKGRSVATDYERAEWAAEAAVRVARNQGAYPLLSGGDVNLYALFVERATRLANKKGIVGLLVPSGIAADKGVSAFFRSVSTTGRLGALLDFENGRPGLNIGPFFPDVHRSFKFCVLVIGGRHRSFPEAACAFFQQDAARAEQAAVALRPADFDAVNPNTGTAPVFRTRRDAEITVGIYRRHPVLVNRRSDPPATVWPVRYYTIFHMTNDSNLFCTADELTKEGAYRVTGGWMKGRAEWLPLYEGKMVQAFDHRAASIVINPENVHRPAQPLPATETQSSEPAWRPDPQFWVDAANVSFVGAKWAVAFKDVTAPTNVRTMIAAAIPLSAVGNTLPLLLPIVPEKPTAEAPAAKWEQWEREAASAMAEYEHYAPLLLANLNAFAFDFVARQKVQGQHLNFYIVEQLPFIPEEDFRRKIGHRTAADIVRDHVLRLTYVADDMEPFARSQGCNGAPFAWDEEQRLHLRARLDALFFQLYGLDRDVADYVLSTFPIVEREERQRFGGRFRSKDLILGYMAAFAAGDAETAVIG
jgi:hypothetical protein